MGNLDMHQLLCHTDVPNCSWEQIPIQSDLNIPLCEQALHNNRDHQLIYFLKYGFPLDIPSLSEFVPNTVITNHQFALQHPECISKYLSVEIQKKAIMGRSKHPHLTVFTVLSL